LNATYSLLGVFSTTGGTNLTLVMTGSQVQAICPNSAPTFTVTAVPTTTTVAPTEFSRGYWLNETDACSTTTAGISLFYSASPTFTSGISIFQDAQLTIPVTQGYVISSGMSRFLVGANGVISTFVCP